MIFTDAAELERLLADLIAGALELEARLDRTRARLVELRKLVFCLPDRDGK